MHDNLKDRVKPKLPHELQRFAVLYARITDIPLGPLYLGHYTFAKDRVPARMIAFITENMEAVDVVAIVKSLAVDDGLFVREEAVLQHLSKAPDVKYWKKFYKQKDYVMGFEKQYNIAHTGHANAGARKQAVDFYKPFVIWLVENHFAFWQVSSVLARTPATIRKWCNEYGYKLYTLVQHRTADTTGKVSRTENVKDGETKQQAMDFEDLYTGEIHVGKQTLVKDSNYPGATRLYEPRTGARAELSMTICVDAGLLTTEQAKRLAETLTWRDVAKRIQNPSHYFQVRGKDKTVVLRLGRYDVYSGIVHLNHVDTIHHAEVANKAISTTATAA